MKTMIMMALLAISAAVVNAQGYGYGNGTISGPDIFGNRTIRYNNGLNGTLSHPDIFGNQTLRYNNGATIQYGSPDIFGNRSIKVQTMPRRYGW